MKYKANTSLLVFLSILLYSMGAVATPLQADASYKIVAGPKNEYVLIMIPGNHDTLGLKHEGVVYKHSGLYHNDKSGKLIAKYDFYSKRTYLSRDGQYLAVLLPQARGFDTELRFYHKEELLRMYPLGKLASRDIAYSITTTKPMVGNLDSDHQLLFQLPRGKLVLFDMSTGEIIQYANRLPDRYNAQIVTRKGGEDIYTQLHICDRSDDEYSLLLADGNQAHRLHIYPDYRLRAHKRENTLNTLARTVVHFKDIAGISLRTNYQTQYIYWLLILQNGDVLNFSTSKQAMKICAYRENLDLVEFSLQDVTGIKLIPLYDEQ